MTQKRSTSSSTRNTYPSTPPREGETSTSPSDFSADAVHTHIITPLLSSKYAGSPLSIKDFEFRSAKSGDILVAKQGQDSEFIMRGVFQISRNDFFFTPDGSYKPNNSINSLFKDVKLSCHLAAPPPNTYPFAVTDFPTCVENLRTFEKIIKPDKKDEITSSLSSSVLRTTQIKLSHALFEPKPKPYVSVDSDDQTDAKEEENVGIESDTLVDLGEEFAMETWPVDERCATVLEALLKSHDLCPLPAYDQKKNLLPPSQYVPKLKGATVEVHFAFIHHYIKSQKRHVYVPTLRELYILSPPAPLLTSPYKRPRVRASTDKGKGHQT